MHRIAILITLAAGFSVCSPKQKPMVFQTPSFDKQGHRGCRGLMPENTIPAMLKAIDLGVTTLEMDLVITKDKQVVLSHEPFMAAEISTSPEGRTHLASEEKQFNIYRMSYAEVLRWDVGIKPHPRFRQQARMPASKPLLADLIDSVEQYAQRKGLPALQYNLETKSDPDGDDLFHPKPEPFVDLIMEIINRKGIAERVIIQSFDPRTLQVMHKKYPRVRTALLVEGFSKLSLDEHLSALGFLPSVYSPEFNLVNEMMVHQCREKGMKLIPWTVNDAASIARIRALGVDGIITDYPNLFQP